MEDHESQEALLLSQMPLHKFLAKVCSRPWLIKRYYSDEVFAYFQIVFLLFIGVAIYNVLSIPAVKLGATNARFVEQERVYSDIILTCFFFLFVRVLDLLILGMKDNRFSASRAQCVVDSDASRDDGVVNTAAYSVLLRNVDVSITQGDVETALGQELVQVSVVPYTGETYFQYLELRETRNAILDHKILNLENPAVKFDKKLSQLEQKYADARKKLELYAEEAKKDNPGNFVFVTFNSVAAAVKFRMDSNEAKLASIFRSPRLKIEAAPYTLDIVWENFLSSRSTDRWRGFLASALTICLGLLTLIVCVTITSSFTVFWIVQAASIMTLVTFIVVFTRVPGIAAKITRKPLYGQQERDLLLYLTAFQILSSSLVSFVVYGLFSVAEDIIRQGIFIDGVVVNIILEFLIPTLVRRGKKSHARKVKEAMDKASLKNPAALEAIFQSRDEMEKKKDSVEYPEAKEHFGFCFRYALLLKSIFISIMFGSAYPSLTIYAQIHCGMQLLIDLLNLKYRYISFPKIHFPCCSVVVIRFMLQVIPIARLSAGMILYANIDLNLQQQMPIMILLALMTLLFLMNILRTIFLDNRPLSEPTGLRNLKERGVILGEYKPPTCLEEIMSPIATRM